LLLLLFQLILIKILKLINENEFYFQVSKLESIIESQSALIQELSKKVKSGQEKQAAMQNEMEKLMDLVTQV
jgi:hypothetical protein